ncbi:hypothetical protein F3Y22_tig00110469pilonHSYRG00259 [Hibiscus syriacus]|uniref:Uncharacterized protein n=1 Tax=Hibiscus syriacus TaxID=106335 RepID=A0A6A3AG07_HIBSY|nr:hypothetical protein F3Y22_tig00110469pilonHSYRG00259 [Hibiscus syriacus]
MEGPCADVEEQTEDQKLRLLLKNLEHGWDFIKKRPEKTVYRTSTGSSKMIEAPGLLDGNFPTKLMSTPFEEAAWKVRTNDLEVEEILRERRLAIESGRLKGRRLFEDVDNETKVGFPFSGLEISLVEESEVRSVFSYESDDNEDENWLLRKEHLSPWYPHCSSSPSSSSSSSLCAADTLQRGSGTEIATMAESGRARLNVIKVFIAISLILLVVFIISMGSFGVYEDEEVILTPT